MLAMYYVSLVKLQIISLKVEREKNLSNKFFIIYKTKFGMNFKFNYKVNNLTLMSSNNVKAVRDSIIFKIVCRGRWKHKIQRFIYNHKIIYYLDDLMFCTGNITLNSDYKNLISIYHI